MKNKKYKVKAIIQIPKGNGHGIPKHKKISTNTIKTKEEAEYVKRNIKEIYEPNVRIIKV